MLALAARLRSRAVAPKITIVSLPPTDALGAPNEKKTNETHHAVRTKITAQKGHFYVRARCIFYSRSPKIFIAPFAGKYAE